MSTKHQTLSVIGGLARLLSHAVRGWPLLLLVVFFLSSEGPHLRVSWTCSGSCDRNYYIHCTYLGSRGFVPALGPVCPLVAWIDSRGGE